ncbi:WD40-repeat-containing domain protein [Russula earlei]|uniref:WD40-repeat-containing domain protein n=1 Tax=Russula earlei TaxID=71964 RepID=A0ACC0UF60_9AGAM|nr:WD40-repeat-containing domain protein [Russula earlei]
MLGSVQNLPTNKGPSIIQQQAQLAQSQQPPNAPNDLPPPPLNGQDFTLSNVLHFLQSEWRKYERDRNEWEIERAEMRARIALLEGERRSFENIKVDLMRRIKMLEYALRVERSKQLSQSAPLASQSVPSAKAVSLQPPSQKDETSSHKEASSPSSPRSEDSPLPPERGQNGALAGASARASAWAGPSSLSGWTNSNGPASAVAIGKPSLGRDPKSRARSRDYLKQCLQEIQYLTSPQALNPLPSRQLVTNPSLPVSLPNVPSFDQIGYNTRPRKLMPEVGKDFPLLNNMNVTSTSAPTAGPSSSGPQVSGLERGPNIASLPSQQSQLVQYQSSQLPSGQSTSAQPGQMLDADKDRNETMLDSQSRTSIYRPDDKGEWREKIGLPYTGSAGTLADSAWDRRPREDDEDVKDEDPEVEEDESDVLGEGEGTKVWRTKRTLRNHLDAVRAVAFHPTELCLATGGDDCTVKIWRTDVTGLASSNSRPVTEVEPQLTLRGHSAAITRLIIAPSKQLIYSASLDSTVRVWALPSSTHTTYAPFDPSRLRGELIGHTDAVWDLALVRDECTLISGGAEGAVKVWDVSDASGRGTLRLSWTYNGVDYDGEESDDLPGVTAVEAIKVDLKKAAVAYQNATIKIFDVVHGKELAVLHGESGSDGGLSQANSIVSHPTMPLLITAHEDKYINIYDINTGQCTYSMPAHLDGVTSLSIDAAGFSLVSGGHDCSIRFWDILGTKACIQEITSHRKKANEGVLDVQFHPSLPFMASAGADGIVKLYASS